MMEGIKEVIVAAIDFGTTYSGYAYSFKSEPSQVFAFTGWSEGEVFFTTKTPTVALFDESGKFNSFGFEAENKYADLVNDGEHKGWRYFRRFKMELAKSGPKKIRRAMKLQDDQGQPMLAMDIFAASIRYLKDHAESRMKKREPELREEDIRWVLTVPAIWDNQAKQFMKIAAEEAGIAAERLTLAYEPEAAAMFCKESELKKRKEEGTNPNGQTFEIGSKFIVLDLGGGTVDITALEVKEDGSLASLSAPSGGAWGGTLVDSHFHMFMEKLFGKRVYNEWSQDDKADKLDLDRAIEVKKRTIKKSDACEKPEVVHIKVPESIFKKIEKQKFEETLKTGEFVGQIEKKRDKLHVNSAICIDMFTESKEKIINHVKEICKEPKLQDIHTLIMAGGFSESDMIYDAVKAAFPQYRVIQSPEASLAIVKGAVLYGHNPLSISSRILPVSYGISTSRPFKENVDPERNRIPVEGGDDKCENIFEFFVKKGENVIPNQTTITHLFKATSSSSTVEVYKSSSRDAQYTNDDDSTKDAEIDIGEIFEQCALKNEPTIIEVQMYFGNTEIAVSACKVGSDNATEVTINFVK